MKILVYSSRPYDQNFLEAANRNKHENPDCIRFGVDYVPLEALLKDSDIVSLAYTFDAGNPPHDQHRHWSARHPG